MILSSHEIVGAAIVNSMPNHPVIGISLALASHYLLDMVPHSDYELSGLLDEKAKAQGASWENKAMLKSTARGVVDFLVGAVICGLIFVHDERTLVLTALGAFVGALPDLLQFIHAFYKGWPMRYVQRFHDFFHSPDKMLGKKVQGYLIQFAFALGAVCVFFLTK